MSTATLRLTEPYVLLIGATEHERALARRRRREAGTPRQTPGNSPPNSRPPSPPPGISAIVEGNFVAPFIPPSSRGGAGARGMSPVPLLAAGGSRSASRSRTMEGTTTGTGTTAEADAADEPPPAMLRGLLTITLAKPSRIRSINVRLRGVSRTDWPEGWFAFSHYPRNKVWVMQIADHDAWYAQESVHVDWTSWRRRNSSRSHSISLPLRRIHPPNDEQHR